MAGVPDPIERRNLLHLEQKKAVDFEGIAEAYLALGRRSDALDFADKAKDPARRSSLLERVRRAAIEAGDAFLLGRVHGLAPASDRDWREALAAAKKAGKTRYALKIARRLGDAGEIAEHEKTLGILPPPPPPEPTPALPAPAGTPPPTIV